MPEGAIAGSHEILAWEDRTLRCGLPAAQRYVRRALEIRVLLPQPEILPRDLALFVERAHEHRAGRYALALVKDQRRATVAGERSGP